MSKNLTFKGTVNGIQGVFINVDGYDMRRCEDVYELVTEPNEYGNLLGEHQYIKGPAIDRLHAFEQLGLEPEEIKNLIDPLDKAWRDMLVKQNDVLRDELRKAQDLNRCLSSGKADLNELLDKKDAAIRKLKERNRELIDKHAKLSQICDRRTCQIHGLLVEKKELQDNYDSLYEDHGDVVIKWRRATQHIKELKAKLDVYERSSFKSVIDANNIKSARDNAELTSEIDGLAKDNKQFQHDNKILDMQIKMERGVNAGLLTKKKELEDHIKELEDIIDKLKSNDETLRGRIDQRDQVIELQKISLANLGKENGELSEELKKFRGMIYGVNPAFIASLREQIDSLKVRNADLMKMNDELEDKLKNHDDRLNALVVAKAVYDQDVKRKTEKYDELEAENKKLTEQNKELLNKFISIKNTLFTMRNAIYGAHPETLKTLKDANEVLKEKNAERMKTIEKLEEQVKNLQDENSELRWRNSNQNDVICALFNGR